MSMSKYDCARNAIGDILDRVSISEKDECRLYECIDVMYDDIDLLQPNRNKESDNMSEKLENLTPKQIIALVAKAKGWIDYPDDGVEQGHYWHLGDKNTPFGPKVYKTAYDPLNISGQALRLVSEFGLSVKTTTIKTMPPTTKVIVSKGIDNQYSVSVQERNIEDMADYHSELERMIRQAVVMVVAKIGLDEPVN